MPATAAAVEMAERSPGWMGMDLNVMMKNSAMPRIKRAKARTAGAAPRRWNRKNRPTMSVVMMAHSSRMHRG